MLDGDLGQQQPTLAVQADQQAVPADFDRICGKRLGIREYAEFNFQLRHFIERHHTETGIFEGRGTGSFGDRAVNGAYWKDVTNASTQVAAPVKRSEDTAKLGEMWRWRIKRNLPAVERGENRVVREAQQSQTLFHRELVSKRDLFDIRCGTICRIYNRRRTKSW